MKTVTYTPDNFLLKDGEVYIFNKGEISLGKHCHIVVEKMIDESFELVQVDTLNDIDNENQYLIVSCTNERISSLLGIPHLERELFVKPVDVEAKARELYPYDDESYTSNDRDTFRMLASVWVKGYNSAMSNSKGEFTREELESAYNSGGMYGITGVKTHTFDNFFKNIHPLSLPKSIQVTDNNWNNPKIVW